MDDSVLESARETDKLAKQAFNAGETDYLQLLTTQRTLFNTQLSALGSAAQAKRAIAEIERMLVTIADLTTQQTVKVSALPMSIKSR
ncbi:hypothetical protein [Stieleria marina]|uniref:hypothetical protein n=1 Tax=Stieleria marina TaxID=1930275 RepID=UPI003AF3EA4D